MIAPRRNVFYEVAGNASLRIKEERFSVHVSPDTPYGHTITETTNLDEGKQIRRRIFVNCQKEQFCWLLFSRRNADLSHPTFAIVPSPRDVIYNIGDFSASSNNLAFHVVVGRVHPWHPRIKFRESYQTLNHAFSYFYVTIVYSYIHLPSMEQGDVISYDGGSGEYNSLTIEELVANIHRADHQLTFLLMKRARDAFVRQGVDVAPKSADTLLHFFKSRFSAPK